MATPDSSALNPLLLSSDIGVYSLTALGGVTEGDAYFEVMSISGFTVVAMLLTLALVTSSSHIVSS